jgi:hypothetical protein
MFAYASCGFRMMRCCCCCRGVWLWLVGSGFVGRAKKSAGLVEVEGVWDFDENTSQAFHHRTEPNRRRPPLANENASSIV